jgi:Mg-chelatase subunit ChlD
VTAGDDERPDAPGVDEAERRRRWRLLLGSAAEGPLGAAEGDDARMDRALATLYEGGDPGAGGPGAPLRQGGLGGSAPNVARWLGDVRRYFPSTVVQVMQRDALQRLDLRSLLVEPELLSSVEPDVRLVGTLLSLRSVIPEQTRSTARQVVSTVVKQVEERVADRTRAAVQGALDRSARTRRPRHHDIDWGRTLQANLRHYQPEHRTVVPHTLVGHGRRQQVVQRDVVLAIDQSGSMASSVVYASVFGAVLASMRSLRTSLVVFDTAVVDLTEELDDPVDLLFGTQLGGGTDINRAIAYCESLVTRPSDTLFVLVSDLYEGGVQEEMLRRVGRMVASGVQVVVLLALSDEGRPVYDAENAAALTALGAPAFACTPNAFPDLLAVALARGDVAAWAAREEAFRR